VWTELWTSSCRKWTFPTLVAGLYRQHIVRELSWQKYVCTCSYYYVFYSTCKGLKEMLVCACVWVCASVSLLHRTLTAMCFEARVLLFEDVSLSPSLLFIKSVFSSKSNRSVESDMFSAGERGNLSPISVQVGSLCQC